MTSTIPPGAPLVLSRDVEAVADTVRDLIARGVLDTSSAVAIIRAVGDVCKAARISQTCIVDVVETVVVEIAKGKDGILGTADDLIPPAVLDVMQTLIHQEVVRELAAWASELTLLPRLIACLTGLLSMCANRPAATS